jgi:uncharacterized protein YecT (DUF1311 family)
MAAVAFVLFAYGAGAGAEESLSARIRQDAPKGITEAFYRCVDAASGNIEQAYCLTQERERQDHRLNATYRTLLGKLNPDQKKQLVEAERGWLKFQNATAGFEGVLYGSDPVDNLQIAQNETFAICKRANELDEYLAVASDL